ncbi:MAG: helix-turn-helix domain-containing protein [Paenibacillaceae bacterium]|nr:helix-turn-helix domain-containing protein [Paenibacillaceae bacterium]
MLHTEGKAPQLKAAVGIDPDVQAHYRFITSVRNTTGRHTHDFFELFLIIRGSVMHCINGAKIRLAENTLVFIRDRDIHFYEETEEGDCQFLNLSFYREALDDLFAYLGEGFPKEKLLAPELPPSVMLARTETEYVRDRLEKLNLVSRADKPFMKAQVRALLAELFTRYVSLALDDPLPGNPPVWLQSLCEAMTGKEHFTVGTPALVRLSGKSHAYLCRVFKRHLGMTPVQYVNGLRLSYAEKLLLTTDMEIVDVCLECGFDNMGHFYDLFKRHYRLPPHAFRQNRRLL